MSIITYIKEVRAEMKNVTWPSRNKAIYATVTVLIISGGIAYFLGFFDFIFTKGLSSLIIK